MFSLASTAITISALHSLVYALPPREQGRNGLDDLFVFPNVKDTDYGCAEQIFNNWTRDKELYPNEHKMAFSVAYKMDPRLNILGQMKYFCVDSLLHGNDGKGVTPPEVPMRGIFQSGCDMLSHVVTTWPLSEPFIDSSQDQSYYRSICMPLIPLDNSNKVESIVDPDKKDKHCSQIWIKGKDLTLTAFTRPGPAAIAKGQNPNQLKNNYLSITESPFFFGDKSDLFEVPHFGSSFSMALPESKEGTFYKVCMHTNAINPDLDAPEKIQMHMSIRLSETPDEFKIK